MDAEINARFNKLEGLIRRLLTAGGGGGGGAVEGTAVLSTGEGGATKFLREDGDGTCSWQATAGGAVDSVFGRTGVVVAAANDYDWSEIDKTTSDIADITTKSHTSLTDVGTNTHAQIDTAVTASTNHIADNTQAHSDYLLNSGSDTTSGTITAAGFTTTGVTLTGDHGTAATDEVVNVCYGTGEAPTASTTTEGALYIAYTA